MSDLAAVGHEIVLGFYQGDPDQPSVLDSPYNAAKMPPYTLPEQWRRSGYVSSSGSGLDSTTNPPRRRPLSRFAADSLRERPEILRRDDHHHNIANDHVLLNIGNIMSLKCGAPSAPAAMGIPSRFRAGGGDAATGFELDRR